MQQLQLEIEGKIIKIFNIYAQNSDDIILCTLETNLDTYNDQTFLVGGDFHTVKNHTLDKLNGRDDTNKQFSNKVNE